MQGGSTVPGHTHSYLHSLQVQSKRDLVCAGLEALISHLTAYKKILSAAETSASELYQGCPLKMEDVDAATRTISTYSKNFLPCLFNMFGSSISTELRNSAVATIDAFLEITSPEVHYPLPPNLYLLHSSEYELITRVIFFFFFGAHHLDNSLWTHSSKTWYPNSWKLRTLWRQLLPRRTNLLLPKPKPSSRGQQLDTWVWGGSVWLINTMNHHSQRFSSNQTPLNRFSCDLCA